MKTIIAGCPTLQSYQIVVEAMESAEMVGVEPTYVIAPNNIGIGILAAKWAGEQRIPVSKMPFQVDKYGSDAGAMRNFEMVQNADALVVIVNKTWFGKPRAKELGVQFDEINDLIETARASNLQIVVWEV